jgi:hypothetical protein
MILAYDSPVWFYVFMVPVFTVLAVVFCVLGYAIWKDTR